jgi:amino acid ABC transporter
MKKEEVSMLLAVDRKRQLKGSLTAEAARDARKQHQALAEVIDKNVRKVTQETLITDIFPLIYDSPAPLAVVDDKDKLVGVIIKGRVIEALANTTESEE